MDASNGCGEHMYDFDDFNEAPGQVRCSKCHKISHTIATHKKRKKTKKLETWNGVIVVRRLERYIHRLKWVLLIYSMHLFVVFAPVRMFHLLFQYSNVVSSFSQLQHGAPALPPS